MCNTSKWVPKTELHPIGDGYAWMKKQPKVFTQNKQEEAAKKQCTQKQFQRHPKVKQIFTTYRWVPKTQVYKLPNGTAYVRKQPMSSNKQSNQNVHSYCP